MNGRRNVSIIGSGEHAAVVASTLLAAGDQVEGFYSDDPTTIGTEILGIPVRGPVDALRSAGSVRAIIGIGSNETRKRIADELSRTSTETAGGISCCSPPAPGRT